MSIEISLIAINNPSDSAAVKVLVLNLLLLLSSSVTSQFAGCDFSESLRIGDTRDIFSPGFPNPYRGQVNCRWTATAPVGTTLQFQCTDVNLPVVSYGMRCDSTIIQFHCTVARPNRTLVQIPIYLFTLQSLNCANDRILVSREGRPALAGALAYCGTQGFTVESTGNRIVIALRTLISSTGGRFLCRLSVLQPCQCGIRNSVS